MRDEIYDRGYQDGRHALHDGIDRLLTGLSETFTVLSRIEFDTPWSKYREAAKRKGAGCA